MNRMKRRINSTAGSDRLQAVSLQLVLSWLACSPCASDGIAAATAVTRGPYLQTGTPTSVVVKWRTNPATDSRVEYGSTAADLGGASTDDAVTTEHEVRLTQLTPGKRYFYAIGTSTVRLAGDANYFFRTSPLPGTMQPVRVWVLGDAGTSDFRQRAVRDAYYAFNGTNYTDLWLMLGDNAYCCGYDLQYQSAVFDMYPAVLRQSIPWRR